MRVKTTMRTRHWIRSNVLGFVALFLVLSGTAWATHIGPRDIADDAIRTRHIANNQVTGDHLLFDSVSASEIRTAAVKTDELASDAVTPPKLSFDPATQLELAEHKNGADHDVRYFTWRELSNSDGTPPNFGPNRVNWNNLGSVPDDFADGTDETGVTQAELNAHKSSGDHDGRYFTESELNSSDGNAPNTGSNRVHWNNLTGMPAGFVDGTDDGGGGGSGWALTGNAGTNPATNFLGTTDNVALNLRVNNSRAFRLEPASFSGIPLPNVIGGSPDNSVTAGVFSATIGGGGRSNIFDPASANRVTDDQGTVSGGSENVAGDGDAATGDARGATVGGGFSNDATATTATVGGGQDNTANALLAIVGGGLDNTASAVFASVGGGSHNTASAGGATVSGGDTNNASGSRATVSGGEVNTASAVSATVGGGNNNTASSMGATVGGGRSNTASFADATVGGGTTNDAGADGATVGGGISNLADGTVSVVAGGSDNDAGGPLAAIGGGDDNVASGIESTVPGGVLNTAAGNFSLAAGRRAKANHDGAFLFADSSDFDFSSTAANEFAVRSTGGARFVSAINASGTPTAGVTLAAGGGSWASLSDEAAKTAIEPISGRDVLDDLASLPISKWSYRSQGPGTRHIGPMAQDFYRTFDVGEDERHITSIDADGVALAAIKGVNERLETKVGVLKGEIARLEVRLAALERDGR